MMTMMFSSKSLLSFLVGVVSIFGGGTVMAQSDLSSISDLGSINKRDYTNETFELWYERTEVTYKTLVGGGGNNNASQTINAAVFVPKNLIKTEGGPKGHKGKGKDKEGSLRSVPVIVHWHGGGLVVGGYPENAWFANWLQELPVQPDSPAILFSVGYRMAPESYAYDTLQDVKDFWEWLHSSPSNLEETLAQYGIRPDLSKILTAGESAGGYLALQSSLLYQPISKVKAVIGQYPSIWPELWNFTGRPENPAANKIIDDYVAGLQPGAIRTSSPYPELSDLVFAYLSGPGRILELYGRTEEEKEYTTLRYALSLKQKELPRFWILQGTADTVVPKSQADELVQGLTETYPQLNLKYTVRDGEHGWDSLYSLERDWIKEGVEFVKEGWLKGKQ